ncbi:UvrD-helicase domain-containing protein [Curvibacter sp. CHRR-16]|uniref:UvrD-helicase domain-containing protein n=1 Tax=Curvibacter sp. CHRR-16 TaxID=2835872 RepID=UPI001BD9D9B2|nr:UvrD-helicase domain-containing protein [Curvibacter sp. CHRR-16]MBT0568732.1 UvrD-helicase domain-containing protein [Curvibacter sp. CHRR-16]
MSQAPVNHSPALAYEHNGQRVASERFYAVACDPRRSVTVEACAGAGKTWMLVSRMLRALLDGARPQDILAITFTKKAAGEMRQRLQEWLTQWASLDDDALRVQLQLRGIAQPSTAQLQAARGLQAHLLQQGRQPQIRTFHSWFAALLGSAPLAVLQALKLPTPYELLEDDSQAVALVWRRFLERLQANEHLPGESAPLQDYLASVAEHGRHQTHKALEAALAKRTEFALADQAGRVLESVAPLAQAMPDFAGFDDPVQRLQQAVVQEQLWAAAKALGACSGKTCVKAASALEKALTDQRWTGKDSVWDALMTGTGSPRKLSEKNADLSSVLLVQELLQRCEQARQHHACWQHQQRLTRLTRLLLQDFAAVKREQGWVDMGDLELAALTLMGDPVLGAWVQERLDAQVRHLFIDEFQDTNPLQWQILSRWLESYGGAGHAPSVFIVGDPKQSIYRFRRAEPQVFVAAQAFVRQALGGDHLSCDHTRRNAPAVLAVVNATMLAAQEQGAYQGYRAHTTASQAVGQLWHLPRLERPAKGAGDADSPEADADEGGDGANGLALQWRDSLTQARHTPEETRKTLECRQAARWLQHYLRSTGHSPGSVMVLSRKRERLSLMEQELAALGLPAEQPENADLGSFAEVQDVVALLDALISPRHDLSLARALKSPLLGCSDDDLVQLAVAVAAARQQGGSPAWLEVLLASVAPDRGDAPQPLSAALQEAATKLQRWQDWLRSLPPHDALHRMYDDGDVLARMVAASPSALRERVAVHVRAVLHAALQLEGARFLTTYQLVRALRAGLVDAPRRVAAMGADGYPSAVQLLTIHGAKGLEAPLVLMLDTDSEAQKADSMGVLVDWPAQSPVPERFAFVASESRPPLDVVAALEREQAERAREELNTLYVALTRAEHALVISSVQPHRGSSTSWWQRLLPHTEQAPGAQGLLPEAGQAAAPADIANAADDADPQAADALPVSPQGLISLRGFYPEKTALQRMDKAGAAINLIANPTEDDALESLESLESRIGQAMHRLLQWLPVRAGGWSASALAQQPPSQWGAARWQQLALCYQLEPEALQLALQRASRIASGQGAWAWDSQHIAWSANEVPVGLPQQALSSAGGGMRYLDRLVRTQQGPWWVLDYKSTANPLDDSALCAQLQTYRQAIAALHPSAVVHAAFLTPVGEVVELPA